MLINATHRNYFYLVNRNNGLIIQSCYLVTTTTFPGNDSLTYARLPGFRGSGQHLITDNGEFSSADPLLVIDTASCHNGQQVTPVASFIHPNGMTGIDFEWLGLLNTDGTGLRPSTTETSPSPRQPFGPTAPPGAGFEDIAVWGFRAKFGGDGNDGCPYP